MLRSGVTNYGAVSQRQPASWLWWSSSLSSKRRDIRPCCRGSTRQSVAGDSRASGTLKKKPKNAELNALDWLLDSCGSLRFGYTRSGSTDDSVTIWLTTRRAYRAGATGPSRDTMRPSALAAGGSLPDGGSLSQAVPSGSAYRHDKRKTSCRLSLRRCCQTIIVK